MQLTMWMKLEVNTFVISIPVPELTDEKVNVFKTKEGTFFELNGLSCNCPGCKLK